jgi:predicted nucleotidyltransferase
VEGLEGVLVDADVLRLTALDAVDTRALDVRVAGAAALLVAKVHKIADRTGTDRQNDKDALDVLRLLRGVSTDDLARRYRRLLGNDRSVASAKRGRTLFEAQFAKRMGLGVQMAIRSAGPLADAIEIAASCEALAKDLLISLEG